MSDDVISQNDQLVLIVGFSATGKSAALRNIQSQEDWLYLNTEAGKKLPFRNKFQTFNITDPYQVIEAMEYAADPTNGVKGIVIDSLTFLMDMFESQYVIGSSNTMQGWSNYNQYFKKLMQEHVAKLGIPVIIIAHTKSELDERSMEMRTFVPVKGSLKNNGIEAYFSCVVAAKKVSIKELDKVSNGMLDITDEDKLVGYKHVFQTRITAKTTGETIRSPMGLFSVAETYIDNDAQKLLNHLQKFYA